MKLLCVLFVVIFGILINTKPAFSMDGSEQIKIQFLLDNVEKAEVLFIRNGKEYTPSEARKHLQMKLEKAGDNIKTADDFINLIATKSSTTNQPYMVKSTDGSVIESKLWFRKTLAGYKQPL